MAECPVLPLFTDALLGDTQHLSQAEFGAYLLMLITAWRGPDCSLPNDPKYLTRITRSGTHWHRIADNVLAFWSAGPDGRLRQKKLSEVREMVRGKIEQRREAGLLSAKRRASSVLNSGPGEGTSSTDKPLKSNDTHSTTVQREFQRNTQRNANETSTTINQIPNREESKKKQKAQPVFEPPDWIPPETWIAFVAMRVKLRKAPTPRACELVVKELIALREKGHDPAAVLEQSIRCSWQDVYPIKERNGHANGRTNGHAKPSARGNFIEGAAQFIAGLEAPGHSDNSDEARPTLPAARDP